MNDVSRTSIETLLQHAAWVRVLARQLVDDEASADDLVQQTWLSAIEHPPQDHGRTRSWLGRVMRRLRYRMRRADHRRARREQRAVIAELPASAAEAIEQAQAHRVVVESLLALEEPFRSTILLRFFRDRSTAEIATELGIAEATVRTRLRRGLKRLRAELEHEHGGDWALALAPLLDGLERGAPAAGASWLAPGGLALMTLHTKLTVAAVLITSAAATALW